MLGFFIIGFFLFFFLNELYSYYRFQKEYRKSNDEVDELRDVKN